MTPDPGPVRGLQLLFTNVEAEQSPTRTRGFQVWLASRDLTPEQRKTIAKRVDDFKLPVPAPADPAAFARSVYAKTPDGLRVFARTVPLDGRDKFGRGGRFHAHAVVLTRDEFARAGGDPGRVFAGLEGVFHRDPSEAMHLLGDKDPALPAVAVEPADVPGVAAVPGDKLARIAAQLLECDGANARVLVVVGLPAAVLAAVRAVTAGLPPRLRRQVTFDTLSAGASLGALPVAVAGCPDAATLARWPFKRVVRLDPATWELLPAPAGPVALPASLLARPGWADLSDADRDRVWAAGDAVRQGKFADPVLADLPPAVAAVLLDAPDVRAALDAAVPAAVRAAVPGPLLARADVHAAAQACFAGGPAAVLARLARPDVRQAVLGVLDRAWTAPGDAAPPAAELAAARELLGGDRAAWPRLAAVLDRWDASVPAAAVARGAVAGGAGEWFRGWSPATLPARLRRPAGAVAADVRARGFRLAPGESRDLALAALTTADGDAPLMHYLAAAAGGTLAEHLKGHGHAPPAADLVADALAAAGGWCEWKAADRPGRGTDVGAWLTAPGGVLDAAFDRVRRKDYAEVLARLLFGARGAPRFVADLIPRPVGQVDQLAKELRKAAAKGDAARVAGALVAADDGVFRRVVDDCVFIGVCGELTAEPLGDDVWWVGVRTRCFDPVAGNDKLCPAALSAVLAAVLPPAGPGSREARRLWWVLHRLRDVNGTHRDAVPAGD